MTSGIDAGNARRSFQGLALAAALPMAMAASATALADWAPERSVEFVVPFSAGGGSDVLARNIVSVIDKLELVPVGIVVENRPGGSGAVGYTYLAERRGDPHYVGTVSVSFFTTPLLGESPVNHQHFTPVAALAYDPYILGVHKDSGMASLDDVIAQEHLIAGTPGIVSDSTILSQLLERETGLEQTIVPYDSGGEVLTALLGQHIDLYWANPTEALPQIEAGEIIPIATTHRERLEALPDVPTFSELGVDITHLQLRGVVMPGDVPAEAVAYWENVMRQVAESDIWLEEYVQRFDIVPGFVGQEEFAQIIERTNDLYAEILKDIGVIE